MQARDVQADRGRSIRGRQAARGRALRGRRRRPGGAGLRGGQAGVRLVRHRLPPHRLCLGADRARSQGLQCVRAAHARGVLFVDGVAVGHRVRRLPGVRRDQQALGRAAGVPGADPRGGRHVVAELNGVGGHRPRRPRCDRRQQRAGEQRAECVPRPGRTYLGQRSVERRLRRRWCRHPCVRVVDGHHARFRCSGGRLRRVPPHQHGGLVLHGFVRGVFGASDASRVSTMQRDGPPGCRMPAILDALLHS
mmetsp:Transcript_15074/g.44698  ORF Transcript_15074/g.44698 Transcript_15074/m.44698 type:complete len:250 (+) Transcript_15074:669-1418(+)